MDEYCSELMLFGGPIGINLKSCLGGKGAYVDSFYKEPFGGVKIGDILWQVNDTPLHDVSIEEIRQMVKNAPGPMKLIFKSFPPLMLCDDVESTSIADDDVLRHRLESAALQLLHDLRGRSWIKRIIKQSYPEVTNKYSQFVIWYECFQLLQMMLTLFPGVELCETMLMHKKSVASSTNKNQLYSAASYLYYEVNKMLSGIVVPETLSADEGESLSASPQEQIEKLQTLRKTMEQEYNALLSKDILPVLQNILMSEHPGMLKYRSYLYYQLKDFPSSNQNSTIGPIFPYLAINDILNSNSGEIVVLTLFLLSMKKYECTELLYRFMHYKRLKIEEECKKASIEVMVMLVRDKLLAKFYESDHYSRLLSHAQINYGCDEEESEEEHECDDHHEMADDENATTVPQHDIETEISTKNCFPRTQSNVQLLEVNLNFLLSDIGISSCTSIHRPRNCEEDYTLGDDTNHMLICLTGNVKVDPERDVVEELNSAIWISLNNHTFDRLNSFHLTRFTFPQLPGTGSVDLLRKAAIDVPISFVLQNFHLPASNSGSAAFDVNDPPLLYGCSIITINGDQSVLKNKLVGSTSDRVDTIGGSAKERRGHRSSFSETDLFQVAVAQASSFKSFASKVVSGASTYLPTLTANSNQESAVEIEMDEYSRSYISYDHCDETKSETSRSAVTNHEVCMPTLNQSALFNVPIENAPKVITPASVNIPIQGFCILSHNQRFLSNRQHISVIWKEFHDHVKENPEMNASVEKIGDWINQTCPYTAHNVLDCFNEEFGFSFIAESLSPQLVITAFLAFLMEIKMVLVSEEASISSHVIIGEWLKQCIQPFRYGQIYAPALGPEVAQQVITCPAPYFAGISLQTFEALKDTVALMDVVVFNLTNNGIQFPTLNSSPEIFLLQEIYEGLRPGNALFDKVQAEMKKTASLLACPLARPEVNSKDYQNSSNVSDSIQDAFPGSIVKFPFDEKKGDSVSILNQLVHELIFGLEYCLIHCNCLSEPQEGSDAHHNFPVILNESLFIKLKRVQMNCPANQDKGLLFGHALGKAREGLIKTILRSQAWSTHITQPK